MTESLTCELCHDRGEHVQPGLAWYRDGGSQPVATIDRCDDHAACRARVEAGGGRWPLVAEYVAPRRRGEVEPAGSRIP